MNAMTITLWRQFPFVLGALIVLVLVWQMIDASQRLVVETSSLSASLLALSPSSHLEQGLLAPKQQQEQKQLENPIFYNLYVPPQDLSLTMSIVQEQMAQRQRIAPNSPLYYTLIGTALSPENNHFTSDFCQPNCRQRAYLKQGDEMDTLQAVWEYCRAHNQEWVTYIHDKGSFHNNPSNRRARKQATRAALQCRQQLLVSSNSFSCNACGDTFNVVPQYHATGNMWTAHCSYVRKLYQPKQYTQALEQLYNQTLLHPTLGNTTYACLQPRTWRGSHTGRGRYAAERWLFSHPAVQPCSVKGRTRKVQNSAHVSGNHSQDEEDEDLTTITFVLVREPQQRAQATKLTNAKFQSSFARLEGRLFEWEKLYNNLQPAQDSWVWKFYRGAFQTGSADFVRQCEQVGAQTRAALGLDGVDAARMRRNLAKMKNRTVL